MGLYDEVIIDYKCPVCGTKIKYFQTKDTPEPFMTTYKIGDKLPIDHSIRVYNTCPTCKTWIELELEIKDHTLTGKILSEHIEYNSPLVENLHKKNHNKIIITQVDTKKPEKLEIPLTNNQQENVKILVNTIKLLKEILKIINEPEEFTDWEKKTHYIYNNWIKLRIETQQDKKQKPEEYNLKQVDLITIINKQYKQTTYKTEILTDEKIIEQITNYIKKLMLSLNIQKHDNYITIGRPNNTIIIRL